MPNYFWCNGIKYHKNKELEEIGTENKKDGINAFGIRDQPH